MALPDDEEGGWGEVDFGGIRRRVCLLCVPSPMPGEYVMVHAGFALARLDEEQARLTLETLQALDALDGVASPSLLEPTEQEGRAALEP